MQSNHEFIQESEMNSVRERVGLEPIHFVQKISVDQIFVTDNLDFGERLSSMQDLPKFASPITSIQTSRTKNYFEATRKIFQRFSQTFQSSHTIYPEEPQHGNSISLVMFLIWFSYALGSAQFIKQINISNLIDFCGMGTALSFTLYNLFIQKTAFRFDHFLHIMGIVITIVMFAYSSTVGDSFLPVLTVIRSFRLFFILNFNYSFKNLALIYSHKLFRIAKVLLPFTFVTLLFSIIMFLSTSNQYYNRCSKIVNNEITSISNDYLCGYKACSDGYQCINPYSYDQIPNNLLYNDASSLAFGFFQYDNFLHSFFTIVSTAFLTNASKIIDIFSSSSPIFLIAIVNILLIAMSFLFKSPIFLILLQENLTQANHRLNELHSVDSKRLSNNNSMYGDLNSIAAPTFGPNSSKSIEKLKKSNRLEKQISFKMGQDEININPPNSKQQSSKLLPTEQSRKLEIKPEGCLTRIFQFVSITFIFLVGSAHAGLALTFVFGNLPEMQNRLVGVCLLVIFIVWSFWFLVKISGMIDDNEEAQKKDVKKGYSTIFSIEFLIYGIHFADYICRIFIGSYLVEESSPITPLATSLLILRIIYIPLAFENVLFFTSFWKNLNEFIGIFKEVVSSIFFYICFMVCFSMVLGTLSTEISKHSYFYESIKYMKLISNSNWLEHYNHQQVSSSLDNSSGWGVILKLFLILIGELFILKLIFADAIIKSFIFFKYIKEQIQPSNSIASIDQPTISKAIQQQKTFFFISFDCLNIRPVLNSFIESQGYTNGKKKLVTIYMFTHLIGYCTMKDVGFYQCALLVGDFLLFLDACLIIIARRFSGVGSFIDNKWYNPLNFIVSIMVIINLGVPMMDSFFIRTLRIFLAIEFYPQLKAAFHKIINSLAIMRRLIIVFTIFWMILTLMLTITFMKSTDKSAMTFSLQSINFSLRLLEQGFDLPSAINFNEKKQLQIYSIYSYIIYFLVSIPFQCLLIGIVLAYFYNHKNQKQQVEILRLALQTQHENNGLTARQDLERLCIKKRILDIAPTFNNIHLLEDNFLRCTFKDCATGFQILKVVCLQIDAVLLLSLPLISQYINEEQMMQVKIARFFFYFLSLMLFIVQSIVYNARNHLFYFKVIIFVGSIPGSFVMMVPFHKVNASQELTNLLQFLLMLAPLPLLQLYFTFKDQIERVIKYILNKASQTVWIAIWIIASMTFFSGIVTMIVKQSFMYVFFMVFIGFCGSSYEFTLEKNEVKSMLAVYIIEIFIFFFGLTLRTIFIASFIFESVQKIKESSLIKEENLQITRADFNKIFEEQKFCQLWSNLDVRSNRTLPFKTVLNYIFHFAKCFNLHNHYIEYILKPREQLFMLKLRLFKRLHFPIRSVAIMKREDKTRHSQYVITMQDLIARFFCLALDDNVHRMENGSILSEVQSSSHTIKNWSTRLGFDSQQWSQQVRQRINTLNGKLFNEQEDIKEKYHIPKGIQTESWSLGSVLSIFPALRRRVLAVKEKLK